MLNNITHEPYWAQAKRYNQKDKEIGYIYGVFSSTGEVLYVGKTKCIETRMHKHQHVHGKNVDVWYFEVPIEDMDETEARYILRYLPPLNKNFPSNEYVSTLDNYIKVDPRFYSQRVTVLHLLDKAEIQSKHGYFEVKDLKLMSDYLDVIGEQ